MGHQTLLEKELDTLYKKVAAGEEKGRKAGKFRRIAAYVLKGVAAGGGLVVATGLLPTWHQGLGIAVLLAVFVDTLSSNHKRLIAEVEAGYAYRALRSRVRGEFNREAGLLYQKRDNGDEEANREIDELMKQAHLALSDGIEEIEKMREKADIEALQSLSLDQERTAVARG